MLASGARSLNKMQAEIIAVGSEMLTHKRVDTNSLFLTEHLNNLGIEVVAKHVVGDDRARIAGEVSRALKSAQIVVLSGGLGPTEDDLTRDAVAAALGRPQILNLEICEGIEERFRKMNRAMPENNRRQAMVIEGAELLSNDRGTAPGQWVADGEIIVILLPGPPHELKSMFTRECLPRLEKIAPPAIIRTLEFRISGMSESELDASIAPVYTTYENPVTTILAHNGDMQVHLRAHGATEAETMALLAEVGGKIEAILGERIYSRNGDPLEAVIGKRLIETNSTLAVAESVTGGGLADRISSIPGSSAWFLGGFVTYSRKLKTELLGVPAKLIEQHGAVSKETAEAMAIGVTGNAGPTTDGGEAPVGTIIAALSGPDGTAVFQRQWPTSDRTRVRAFAAQMALDALCRKLRD